MSVEEITKEPHIWLLNKEGEPGVYDVEYMMKSGAKFYRRPLEKGSRR